MLYVEQSKGDGGGGDGAEGNSDKDRMWMRMYHFSGEQLRGQLRRRFHEFITVITKLSTTSSNLYTFFKSGSKS